MRRRNSPSVSVAILQVLIGDISAASPDLRIEKLERRLADGLQPFVKLPDAGGLIYTAAPEFLEQIAHAMKLAVDSRHAEQSRSSSIAEASIRLLSEFHNDPRYAGDLHRADMAWALHAASCGLPPEQIKDEILQARDLSKKGRFTRQLIRLKPPSGSLLALKGPIRLRPYPRTLPSPPA